MNAQQTVTATKGAVAKQEANLAAEAKLIKTQKTLQDLKLKKKTDAINSQTKALQATGVGVKNKLAVKKAYLKAKAKKILKEEKLAIKKGKLTQKTYDAAMGKLQKLLNKVSTALAVKLTR